jgi:hypothetical protein
MTTCRTKTTTTTTTTTHTPSARCILCVPAHAAAHLRHVPPTPINTYIGLAFLAKTQREFRARDDRATWMCGYWCGLLCRFDAVWWCRQQRAWRDYAAVLAWLRLRRLRRFPLRPGAEGERWAEMMAELEMVPFVGPEFEGEGWVVGE